jgi:hypothetical protein
VCGACTPQETCTTNVARHSRALYARCNKGGDVGGDGFFNGVAQRSRPTLARIDVMAITSEKNSQTCRPLSMANVSGSTLDYR